MKARTVAIALCVLAAALCVVAAAHLLSRLGRPEAAPADPRAPRIHLSLETTRVPLQATLPLFVEIRNESDAPLWIVEPADDLFLLADDGAELRVIQHFPEDILRDPLANRFAAEGGIPPLRRLDPGDEAVRTIRVRETFDRPGRRTVRFSLAYGVESPDAAIPAPPRASPAERIARYLAWQRKAEAAPVEIEIK